MDKDQDASDSMLQEQLLRYAEDLQQLLARQSVLESRFEGLHQLAHYDALTGLPNRRLFLDRLAPMLTLSRRPDDSFTLIFIDLDGFKRVNDSQGHPQGDHVLQTVARRLLAAVRDSDTVARLGGDEFVIIARSLKGDENIAAFCDKAIRAIGQPMYSVGVTLVVGCSIGCAEFPRHGEDEVSLLTHADAAMYHAKAAGGNTFRIHA